MWCYGCNRPAASTTILAISGEDRVPPLHRSDGNIDLAPQNTVACCGAVIASTGARKLNCYYSAES